MTRGKDFDKNLHITLTIQIEDMLELRKKKYKWIEEFLISHLFIYCHHKSY